MEYLEDDMQRVALSAWEMSSTWTLDVYSFEDLIFCAFERGLGLMIVSIALPNKKKVQIKRINRYN